jgi:MFS family permease
LIAIFPAVLGLAILFFGIQESSHKKQDPTPDETKSFGELLMSWKQMGTGFKFLLFALLIFTLGNSTDAFLLMRLSEAGISPASIALLWSAHHVAKMFSTYAGGIWADKIGSKLMIGLGWLFFAMIYTGFALIETPFLIVACFLLYGLYYGLVEPAERALVADLVPAHLRGTAFGYYNFIVGIATLPASLLFGALWHFWGSAAAFTTGAALAAVATCFLTFTSRMLYR